MKTTSKLWLGWGLTMVGMAMPVTTWTLFILGCLIGVLGGGLFGAGMAQVRNV